MYFAVYKEGDIEYVVSAESFSNLSRAIGLNSRNYHYERIVDDLVRTDHAEWIWYDIYEAKNLKRARDLKLGDWVDLDMIVENTHTDELVIAEDYDSTTNTIKIMDTDTAYDVDPDQWVPTW